MGAIAVGEAEFATQPSDPENGASGPGVVDVVDKQRPGEGEDMPHAFRGSHLHPFDIQSVLLVEAVDVFDLGGTTTPFDIDRSSIFGGYVSEC